MIKNIKIIFIFLSIFSILGCDGKYKHHMSINDPKGIDTSYELSQKSLKIKNHEEPFLLFFFSTACNACLKQVPFLNAINEEFKDKIMLIGVLGQTLGVDKDLEILKRDKVNFMVLSSKDSVNYFSSLVGGVMGVPVTFLYDKEGKLYKSYLGLTPKRVIENDIKIIL